MGGFLKALLLTAVMMIVWVPISSFIGALVLVSSNGSIPIVIFTTVPVILVALGFVIARRIRIAVGILADGAIGLAVMWLSCFAVFQALGV